MQLRVNLLLHLGAVGREAAAGLVCLLLEQRRLVDGPVAVGWLVMCVRVRVSVFADACVSNVCGALVLIGAAGGLVPRKQLQAQSSGVLHAGAAITHVRNRADRAVAHRSSW